MVRAVGQPYALRGEVEGGSLRRLTHPALHARLVQDVDAVVQPADLHEQDDDHSGRHCYHGCTT